MSFFWNDHCWHGCCGAHRLHVWASPVLCMVPQMLIMALVSRRIMVHRVWRQPKPRSSMSSSPRRMSKPRWPNVLLRTLAFSFSVVISCSLGALMHTVSSVQQEEGIFRWRHQPGVILPSSQINSYLLSIPKDNPIFGQWQAVGPQTPTWPGGTSMLGRQWI